MSSLRSPADLLRREHDRLRHAAHEVAPPTASALYSSEVGNTGADGELHLFGVHRWPGRIKRRTYRIAASMSNEPTRTASRAPPTQRDDRHLTRTAPMSTTCCRVVRGSAGGRADRRGHRLPMRKVCRAPGAGGFESTARCSTWVMAEGTQISTRGPLEPRDAGALEQHADQALGDLEVGDGAAAQGPHRDDVAGRASDHLPGVVTEREHLVRPRVHRAMTVGSLRMIPWPRAHERVRGAEIDREVARQGGPGRPGVEVRRPVGRPAIGRTATRWAQLGAVGPVLALPDRHRLLERVDAEAGRLERLGAVRRRRDHRHRRLRQHEVTDAVEQREAFHDRPPAPSLDHRLGSRRVASSS